MGYIPPIQNVWTGRKDGSVPERYHEVIRFLDLNGKLPSEKGFALLGFCCDVGIARNQGRIGAAEGPKAFRSAFAKLPIPSDKSIRLYDAGDIFCVGEDLEAAQGRLAEAVQTLFKCGLHPIVVGGGHELAWGHYQGLAAAHPNTDFAIVNIDAHLDIRPLLNGSLGTSGTSFLQIAQACRNFDYTCIGVQEYQMTKSLRESAKALKIKITTAEEIQKHSPTLPLDKPIYLTLCLDVFASAFAPGVSAPQPLGLTPLQVLPIIQTLARSGKVLTFSIAELSPPYDRDHTTAALAAACLSSYIKF